MSGGEAFVILAAADIAMCERRARCPGPATREGHHGGRLTGRSWTEILVVATAGIVILLMVALGGVAAERVASAAASEAGTTVVEPDPLTICSTINQQTTCVREAT